MSEYGGGLALYQQISRKIERDIEAGRYPVGEQLPTEHSLSQSYGVNRHTAREALRQLKDEGLVYSIRGKGTFVAHSKVMYRVSKKVRFTNSILEAGLTPGATLLRTSIVHADDDLCQRLKMAVDERVVKLEILRSVDGIPFTLSVSWLPADRFSRLPQFITEEFSLYALLRDVFGVEASRKFSIFEVAMPVKQDIEALQISRNVPLLMTSSLALDQDQRPVEFCVSRMRGDLGSIAIDFTEK